MLGCRAVHCAARGRQAEQEPITGRLETPSDPSLALSFRLSSKPVSGPGRDSEMPVAPAESFLRSNGIKRNELWLQRQMAISLDPRPPAY